METMRTAPLEITLDEFELLSSEEYRNELSRGYLVREPRPGVRHNDVAAEIYLRLRTHVTAHDLGSVEFGSGYILEHSPATLRAPDVSVVSKERLPAERPTRYWMVAPDLAVEVLSPSNKASEIERKVLEYLEAGTSVVWVVDPQLRIARIYRGNDARLVREGELLSAEEVLPGFAVLLREVLPPNDAPPARFAHDAAP